MEQEKKEQVFIISQIGEPETHNREWADNVSSYIVSPIANEFNLSILRSDGDHTPGPVTPQILRSMLESKLVVADLTGRNPNVYYELCFAHSFGLPVVSLVDDTSSLPFDMKDERVITLANDNGKIDISNGEKAKSSLRDAFKIVLEENYEPKSIVNDVASVQSIENMSPSDPVVSQLSDLSRKVEQIHEKIHSVEPEPASSGRSGYKPADLKNLMELFEVICKEDRPPRRAEIENMEDLNTSPKFDTWLKRAIDKLEDLPF